MQEFLLKKVYSAQAAQQPSYSCLDLNHSGAPHQVIFNDRSELCPQELIWSMQMYSKKRHVFHLFPWNWSSPSAHCLYEKLSSSWAMIHYMLLNMEMHSYQPLLDTWRTGLLLHLDREQMRLTKSIVYCMHNSCLLFYLSA